MLRLTLNYTVGAQQLISDDSLVFTVLPIATKKLGSQRKNLFESISKQERDGARELWHHLEIFASALKYPRISVLTVCDLRAIA